MLIYSLEGLFAAEDSELQQESLDVYEKFSRGRGQNMPEYIVDWEYFLYDGQLDGYQANSLILSRELLKKARLTEDEKRWVLLPLQGDLRRYDDIKTLLKRLPSDHAAEVFLATDIVGNPNSSNVWFLRDSGPDLISTEWTGGNDMPDAVWAVMNVEYKQHEGSAQPPAASMVGQVFLADDWEEVEGPDEPVGEYADDGTWIMMESDPLAAMIQELSTLEDQSVFKV
jgi:hypothetical protein